MTVILFVQLPHRHLHWHLHYFLFHYLRFPTLYYMKRIYLFLFAVVFLSVNQSNGQAIPNAGFESWIQVGDDHYPEFWDVSDSSDVKDGYIERSTESNSESYAVKFNTYMRSYAPNVEIYRAFSGSSRPDSFQFSVKIVDLVNTNSDGAIADIFFYDANEDYVRDISIRINKNTDWQTVTQALGDLSNINYYKINLYLVDFSRSANTYAIFDDLKFITNEPSSVQNVAEATDIINVFPNPSGSGWLNVSSYATIKGYEVISSNGTIVTADEAIQIDHLDLTEMAAGLYTIRFTLEDDSVVFRRIRIL